MTEPIDLSTLRASGTEVHYYVLCPRKLWWFAHKIELEHVTGGIGAENVAMGVTLHEGSYSDRPHREVMIDNLLRMDFTDSGAVHEIKKSRGAHKASVMQLMY